MNPYLWRLLKELHAWKRLTVSYSACSVSKHLHPTICTLILHYSVWATLWKPHKPLWNRLVTQVSPPARMQQAAAFYLMSESIWNSLRIFWCLPDQQYFSISINWRPICTNRRFIEEIYLYRYNDIDIQVLQVVTSFGLVLVTFSELTYVTSIRGINPGHGLKKLVLVFVHDLQYALLKHV